MKVVEIYTDGCALLSEGKMGGAGVVMIYKKHIRRFAKYLPETTNNRAELEAVILALTKLKEPCQVWIYSDSQITVNCANGTWKRNANVDLWDKYDELIKGHTVTLQWIRKDTQEHNTTAHELANAVARNKPQ